MRCDVDEIERIPVWMSDVLTRIASMDQARVFTAKLSKVDATRGPESLDVVLIANYNLDLVLLLQELQGRNFKLWCDRTVIWSVGGVYWTNLEVRERIRICARLSDRIGEQKFNDFGRMLAPEWQAWLASKLNGFPSTGNWIYHESLNARVMKDILECSQRSGHVRRDALLVQEWLSHFPLRPQWPRYIEINDLPRESISWDLGRCVGDALDRHVSPMVNRLFALSKPVALDSYLLTGPPSQRTHRGPRNGFSKKGDMKKLGWKFIPTL